MSKTYIQDQVSGSTLDAYNSAQAMPAAKYIAFDDKISLKDALSMDNSHARGRVNDYVQQVLDRQYEMDVRQHQEDLENSAYTRAVQDMKNAGLNPYWLVSSAQGASSETVAPSSSGHQSSNKSSGSNKQLMNSLIRIAGTALLYMLLA